MKGESGSGKSTFLNCISLIDKPSSGKVLYNGKNILSFKEKERRKYLRNDIAFIFQNYHLFEGETVLFNVELPLLISGDKAHEQKAKETLSIVNIPEDLFSHKVSDLSGGEKQRVAIARALVKDAPLLLCDEPTGSVDQANAHEIMNILKRESEHKLVITVSHNEELIEEYADQILFIENGKLKDARVVNETSTESKSNWSTPEVKEKKSLPYISHLAFSNFKRRKKQTIFNGVVMMVCLLFSLLIIGFITNIPTLIENQAALAFDYPSLTLYGVQKEEVPDTNLSLTKSYRPTEDMMRSFQQLYPHYIWVDNLDYFFSTGSFSKNETTLYELVSTPIYQFDSPYVNYDLLISGDMPKKGELNEVVINKSAYEYITSELGVNPAKGFSFHYYINVPVSYTDPLSSETIIDYFEIDDDFTIRGVVDDFSFLESPKVYYSYMALFDVLSESVMENVSDFRGEEYTFMDYLNEANDNNPVTSYSYQLFLKDYHDCYKISEDIASLPSNYQITSLTESRVEAFSSTLDAVRIGLIFFLVIVIIICLILIGIICLSTYLGDSKQLAILLSLGAKKDDTIKMYIYENILTCLIAVTGSFILSYGCQYLINWLLRSYSGISPFISIPFSSFMGVPFLLPIFIFLVAIMFVFISCSLPIMTSGRISLKEELQNSD
ncbi:MAG: ATP-binding cassette domain-containing protein [Coprobacillus sp.]|nr:ATP-binding cassette domain-containing protein [Coprobacillus sp.]